MYILNFVFLGDKNICCHNVKPPIEPGVCSDNNGKECLPINECELNSTILTNSRTSSLLDIRSNGLVDLNADANPCKFANEVCCTKDQKPQPQCGDEGVICPRKSYAPKCGQRNSDGSNIRITNPLNGKEATQKGEWPHACILYKNNGQDFLGGASLIAPGILTTATHKVK